jgi:4-hydroxyphenylpyruvate dioxygenase
METPLRRSIATVSLGGTLQDKLKAVAEAGFDAVELCEDDLPAAGGGPRRARRLAADLGLAIDLFQPLRDVEGVPDDVFARNLDRAERALDVTAELGAPTLLVCSNVSQAIADDQRAAAQLRDLAARAARRGVRVAYEALSWGTHVRTYGHAWQIVRRAAHPRLGLALDSFHTLALADDPAGIGAVPGRQIFVVQVADAPRLALDARSWSRHHRCFPGDGDLDIAGFLAHVRRSGYAGPLSLEIFNDVLRAAAAGPTARAAMRSLRDLEAQAPARAARRGGVRRPLHGAPATVRAAARRPVPRTWPARWR